VGADQLPLVGNAEPGKTVIVVAARLPEIARLEVGVSHLQRVAREPDFYLHLPPGLTTRSVLRMSAVSPGRILSILEKRYAPLVTAGGRGDGDENYNCDDNKPFHGESSRQFAAVRMGAIIE